MHSAGERMTFEKGWGKKRVHNLTSLALQNLVETAGHDAVGSFGLSPLSHSGV